MAKANGLERLTAHEAARRIAAREITSEALVQACLARIAARESEVGAFAFIDPAQALAQARAADGAAPRGPLHGVPVAIKDIIDTSDMPTAYGSPIYEGHRPACDAARLGGSVSGPERLAGGADGSDLVAIGKALRGRHGRRVYAGRARRRPGRVRRP